MPEGRALDHVAGYTVLNDLSDRANCSSTIRCRMTSFAKGLDGFCPMGPWLVTADEVGEPWQLGLRCWLNDEKVQEGNTHDLIFSVAALIAWLSPLRDAAAGRRHRHRHARRRRAFPHAAALPQPRRPAALEVDRVGMLEHGIA